MKFVSSKAMFAWFSFAYWAAIVVSVIAAISARPVPVSDYLIHWASSLDFARYIKSGALIYVIGGFSRLGLEPYLASVAMHLLVFSLLYFHIRKTWRSGQFESSFFRAAFLLSNLAIVFLSAALVGFLEVITIASVLMLVSITSLFFEKNRVGSLVYVALLSLAFSMRIQAVLIFLVGLIPVLYFSLRKALRIRPYAWIAVAMVAGVALEIFMISQSREQTLIRREKLAPFYTGFVLPVEGGGSCGSWNSRAYEEALRNSDRGFLGVLISEVGKREIGSTVQLAFCKNKRVFTDGVIGTYWLNEAWKEKARLDSLLMGVIVNLEKLGLLIGRILILLTAGAIVAFRDRADRRHFVAIASALILGYIAVFSLFEVNSRYLIGLVTLMAIPWYSVDQEIGARPSSE